MRANRWIHRTTRCFAGLRRDDGQSLLEMAISLLAATILALGFIEMSMFAYTCSVLYESAHEGMRYAIVHGSLGGNAVSGGTCSTTSPGGVITAVTNAAKYSLHDMSRMTVNVCYPDAGGSSPLSLVTIKATYTYVPYFNLPGITPTLTVSSQGRIVY